MAPALLPDRQIQNLTTEIRLLREAMASLRDTLTLPNATLTSDAVGEGGTIGGMGGTKTEEKSTEAKKRLKPVPSTKVQIPEQTPGFIAFYGTYPRKVGRRVAARAYAKLLKEAMAGKQKGKPWREADRVLSAFLVERVEYQLGFKHGDGLSREPQYQKHPSSWLNGGHYEDEPGE